MIAGATLFFGFNLGSSPSDFGSVVTVSVVVVVDDPIG
ncbi:MAG: hypothetical protein UX12_C0022G0007, partial [Candidatus Collierbacteria bacterium GW2011_GWC1_45_47]